jgi:hypothetical protein
MDKIKQHTENKETDDLPGYPEYAADEDIYSKFQEEKELNPEDISTNKAPVGNYKSGTRNEKYYNDDLTANDLDIPGSELDDQQEDIGSEDEENNYYSLGGDNHDDLDENRGE